MELENRFCSLSGRLPTARWESQADIPRFSDRPRAGAIAHVLAAHGGLPFCTAPAMRSVSRDATLRSPYT